jgi:hypothetical protein
MAPLLTTNLVDISPPTIMLTNHLNSLRNTVLIPDAVTGQRVQTAPSAQPVEDRDGVKLTPLADFNEVANVARRPIISGTLLMQRRESRLLRNREERRRGTRSSAVESGTQLLEEDDSGIESLSTVDYTLDMLMRHGRSKEQRAEVEAKLAENLSPSQRFDVLLQASLKVEGQAPDSLEKKNLRNALEEMRDDIWRVYKQDIRKRLHDERTGTASTAGTRRTQDAGTQSFTKQKLRFLPGAHRADHFDGPLRPSALIEWAMSLGHDDDCLAIVQSMGTQLCWANSMKRRVNPLRNFPAHWLAMQDAAALSITQTALALASRLRLDLAEQARVLARKGSAPLAALLLQAAEMGWGKPKVKPLVNQIVDLNKLDPARAAKAYALVHEAMNKLPPTLWPQEKQGARKELLDELQEHVRNSYDKVPRLTMKEEQMEQEWLATLAACPKKNSEYRAN